MFHVRHETVKGLRLKFMAIWLPIHEALNHTFVFHRGFRLKEIRLNRLRLKFFKIKGIRLRN